MIGGEWGSRGFGRRWGRCRAWRRAACAGRGRGGFRRGGLGALGGGGGCRAGDGERGRGEFAVPPELQESLDFPEGVADLIQEPAREQAQGPAAQADQEAGEAFKVVHRRDYIPHAEPMQEKFLVDSHSGIWCYREGR